MPRKLKIKNLTGRITVTKDVKTGRIHGVWHKGKFHSPKSSYKMGIPFKSAVRLKGKKTVYYYPK